MIFRIILVDAFELTMADILLVVVDVLAEIFRVIISQRYLLLLAGLVWWFLHCLQTSLDEEEHQEEGRQNSVEETESLNDDQISNDLNDRLTDNLDNKLDASLTNAGPYIMPLSSNVATDSEPCDSQTLPSAKSTTFLKLRATFEKASNQNNTSWPCLAVPRFEKSALSHSHTITTPTRSPYYGQNYDQNYQNYQNYEQSYVSRLDLKVSADIRRPLSPRSLGNSPAHSPREERRSRDSKRLSVCGKCRTAGKSTSWSEADSQLRGRVKRTPDRDPSPTTNVFYCGRYISVSNGKQVQIGDHCKMNVTAANSEEYDDGSATDGDSIVDHLSDLDSQVVTDSEHDDPFILPDEALHSDVGCTSEDDAEDNEPLVCSFCRAKMTDDEKSELLPVADARRPVRSITYPLGIPTDDEDVLETGIAHIAAHQSRSASVSADGAATPPITDEEKEKLFRDAKVKIFEATRRHRELSSSSPNFEREDTERKSLRTLTFWKRRKQSTEGKTKAS